MFNNSDAVGIPVWIISLDMSKAFHRVRSEDYNMEEVRGVSGVWSKRNGRENSAGDWGMAWLAGPTLAVSSVRKAWCDAQAAGRCHPRPTSRCSGSSCVGSALPQNIILTRNRKFSM